MQSRCFKRSYSSSTCDVKEDLLCELNLLKYVFIANGNPKKLVEITLKNSWNVELEKQSKALLHIQNEEEKNEEQEDEKKWLL